MPAEISPLTLWTRLLLGPNRPDIVDVCLPEDADAIGGRIPASRRSGHRQAQSGAEAVVICHKGLKLSHGVAARLRADGGAAVALEGGIVAWRDAGLPILRETALSETGLYVCSAEDGRQSAVLRWLVDRLLPPGGALMAVPGAIVADVADRFDATLLTDAEAALDQFGLVMAPLQELAREATRGTGPLGTMLGGLVDALGAGEIADRAAAPIFDAFAVGSMQ
ncbi:MAG: hypothetical protein AAFU80_02345 [Pseudomonadota bacterium]